MRRYDLFLAILPVLSLVSCTELNTTNPPINLPKVKPTIEKETVIESTNITSKTQTTSFVNPCDRYANAGKYNLVLPPPPLTGTERQTPIVLMTRQQFNEKIWKSPLWESVYDKKLYNGSYCSSYSFKPMFKLIGSSSYIRVYSELDGEEWRENQRITSLTYGQHSVADRIPYGHQLLDQERYEMIEMVTMVIEDRDKAIEIVDKLYQQYRQKVNNKDYLSDGETIHTHLQYDGKYFSMRGGQRLDHKIEQCNYKMLSGLVIN